MIMRYRNGLVSAALLVVWLLAAPPAAHAATKPVITTFTAMTGVPSHVAARGTLSFTLTFTQNSPYQLYLDGLAVEIWNRCLCSIDDTNGTKATYLDPTTGTWRTSPAASGDAYGSSRARRFRCRSVSA